MASKKRLRLQPDHRMAFLQGFLKSPKQVGSIIPSSRFLERRIVRASEIERASLVVELGPGTGGTTRALLRAMSPKARLLAIEIDPASSPAAPHRPAPDRARAAPQIEPRCASATSGAGRDPSASRSRR
jgi:hypothetical protein